MTSALLISICKLVCYNGNAPPNPLDRLSVVHGWRVNARQRPIKRQILQGHTDSIRHTWRRRRAVIDSNTDTEQSRVFHLNVSKNDHLQEASQALWPRLATHGPAPPLAAASQENYNRQTRLKLTDIYLSGRFSTDFQRKMCGLLVSVCKLLRHRGNVVAKPSDGPGVVHGWRVTACQRPNWVSHL